MSRNTTTRKYGKQSKRSKAERLFAELPQSPIRTKPAQKHEEDSISLLTEKISSIKIDKEKPPTTKARRSKKQPPPIETPDVEVAPPEPDKPLEEPKEDSPLVEEPPLDTTKEEEAEPPTNPSEVEQAPVEVVEDATQEVQEPPLRTLTWDDVCPPGDKIDKIAEASYAEVYRVRNDRGTSIIKVIRLPSPIKPQTKAQVRSGLVDEEPHSEEDIQGELQISEWLADIPGFVIYKERYVVQGKTTRELLETHQSFQKKMKRQDPDRAQFYPSPSRYLDDTRFLVVELGDAGTALEDWNLTTESQLWDIFLLQAIALARAEDLVMFEVSRLESG
jgi:serine/threonine-protein kinase haspin